MPKPPAPETGKPVQLPANTDIVLAPIKPEDFGPCLPPGSLCQTFVVKQLEETIGLSDARLLALEIASTKKQNLDLTIEIATGEYKDVVFVTKTQKLSVQTGNTLVGLDPRAAEAAQPYFVSGNTVTLAVQPKDAGVKVKVGKQVDGGKAS